jgi:hypothetical protein
MRPYIRMLTFFGGGTQLLVLTGASVAGAPMAAWWYIGVFSNLVFVPAALGALRAHRALRAEMAL